MLISNLLSPVSAILSEPISRRKPEGDLVSSFWFMVSG
jgi:hypothetical protein